MFDRYVTSLTSRLHKPLPFVWAAPRSPLLPPGISRFSPADAGSTARQRRLRAPATSHPRLRGLFLTCMSLLSYLPSPPRPYELAPVVELNLECIAEALPLAQARVNGEGPVSPARAGSTPRLSAQPTTDASHPRLRERYTTAPLRARLMPGSLPLAQATCTGGSRQGLPRALRSHGFYTADPSVPAFEDESVPLARALQGVGTRRADPRRVSPARAGSALRQSSLTAAKPCHCRSYSVLPYPQSDHRAD